MVKDGNKESSVDDSFLEPGSTQQNFSLFQSQTVQRSVGEKSVMEMEGRGYSDFYRNTSEELFLKSLMESSIGMPIPTMEMLGFKNLNQSFRTDSEELFKSWLTNGENINCSCAQINASYRYSGRSNHGYNATNIAHRTRQTSRKISTELGGLSSQQHGVILQNKRSSDILFPQKLSVTDDLSSDVNQHSVRNAAERGLQGSNLFLAKAWFHSSQPMTRSRSSELRRRYVAMQSSQTPLGMEVMNNASEHGMNKMKQEFTNPNGFGDVSMCEMPDQLTTFMSPSNSSSSTFNTPQMGNVDKVSSVVSMLKGTLERKKLTNQMEKEAVEDSSIGYYCAPEVVVNTTLGQGQGNNVPESSGAFHEVSPVQVKDHGDLQIIDGSMDLDLEGFVAPMNPIQMSTVSQEPSQSESSAAAPVISAGFDACDGPSNSGQTLSVCESSRKQVGNGGNSEHDSRAKEIRKRIFESNLKDEKKKGSLIRYGSVTSSGSVDKGDPTKKRRVERSRKMAEAKERNLTPSMPSDMQSILKRCETFEKEVRSLKLNLSFMNRKDSEQTKQIEELQKQNEELADEKERLLEEIERILAETGKM